MKYLFLSLCMFFVVFCYSNNGQPESSLREKYLMKNFLYNAMNYHYEGVALDEVFSRKIFTIYGVFGWTKTLFFTIRY